MKLFVEICESNAVQEGPRGQFLLVPPKKRGKTLTSMPIYTMGLLRVYFSKHFLEGHDNCTEHFIKKILCKRRKTQFYSMCTFYLTF